MNFDPWSITHFERPDDVPESYHEVRVVAPIPDDLEEWVGTLDDQPELWLGFSSSHSAHVYRLFFKNHANAVECQLKIK